MTVLELISYIAIISGIVSALIILNDVIKKPQHMTIMNSVWPIQGFYLGPFAIWFYWVMGRQNSDDHEGNEPHSMNLGTAREHAKSIIEKWRMSKLSMIK